MEGVEALRVTQSITVLRGICNKRLKFDIEYSRKRGTTDNTYLIKVRLRLNVDRGFWGIVPVPSTSNCSHHCRPSPPESCLCLHHVWRNCAVGILAVFCNAVLVLEVEVAILSKWRCSQHGTLDVMCLQFQALLLGYAFDSLVWHRSESQGTCWSTCQTRLSPSNGVSHHELCRGTYYHGCFGFLISGLGRMHCQQCKFRGTRQQ